MGGLKFSPDIFLDMTPNECILLLKGHKNEQKSQYYYDLYANFNAIGSCMGGKKFKPVDPFKDDKDDDKPKKTKEQVIAEYKKLETEEW